MMSQKETSSSSLSSSSETDADGGVSNARTTSATGEEQEERDNGHFKSGGSGVGALKVEGLSLQSGTRLRLQHLSAATGLIATYLIEIGVQIFLIFHCWRSLVFLVSSWDWPSSLVLSSTLTSLLVTIMSMVWVCRGLDFVGRACARLLCYVMHFCLLGLVWRYLKLAFAYDHADVQEFVALRIFQMYIQSLPVTSIHLAWLITFPEEWFGVAFWVILLEIISISAGLIIAAYVKCDSSPPPTPKMFDQVKTIKTTQIFSDSLKRSVSEKTEKDTEVVTMTWPQVLCIEFNILGRMMLLVCRLIVLGMLVAHLKLWTSVALLIHFAITIPWISCTEKQQFEPVDEEIGSEITGEATPYSPKEFVLHVLECSYILLWDITSSLQGPMKLSAWALPGFLVIFENGALLIFYSYEAYNVQLVLILICTGCLILGLILFSFFNFVQTEQKFNCCGQLKAKSRLSLCSSSGMSSSFRKKDGGGGITTTTPIPSESSPGMNSSNKSEDDFCCTNNYDDCYDNDDNDEKCCWKDNSKVNNMKQQQQNDISFVATTGQKMMTVTNSGSGSRQGSWDLNLTRLALEKGKPLIMANNYTNISEVLMTAHVKTAIVGNGTTEKVRKNGDVLLQRAVRRTPPIVQNAGDSPPDQRATNPAWVPDTCCNDSNGSSNSRNTNTLLELPGTGTLTGLSQTSAAANNNNKGEQEDDMVLDNPADFVFYFPEQRTLRHHSVVRKLNVRSTSSEQIPAVPPPVVTRARGRTSVSPAMCLTMTAAQKKSQSHSSRSRGSPATSFNSSASRIRAIVRTSTPVEIKKAARVIMNYPKHHHQHRGGSGEPRAGSRCHCHHQQQQQRSSEVHQIPEVIDPKSDPFYEKLMEDSYGILICEGEPTSGTRSHPHSHPQRSSSGVPHRNLEESLHHSRPGDKSVKLLPSIFHVNQKLKVLCAKCLQNHDPLLTNCLKEEDMAFDSRLEPRVMVPRVPPIPSTSAALTAVMTRNPALTPPLTLSETTEYPSETEMTWTAAGEDQESVSSSHLSTATYTTWPRKGAHYTMSMWTSTTASPYPKEFTSREYVRTWLLTSQARAKHYYNLDCELGSGGSGALKRVHRSRTISTGAGGSLSRNISHNRPGSHQHHHTTHSHPRATAHHKSDRLGKRHGPVGRGQGQSPQSAVETLSILPSLVLTPPPKQKQHPVLPHSLRFEISVREQQHQQHHQGMHTHSRSRSIQSAKLCKSKHQRRSRASKDFYKDLEIIV